MAEGEDSRQRHAPQGREQGVGGLIRNALWRWGCSSPRCMAFLLQVAWSSWRANRRRIQQQRRLGISIPPVVAISPTMSCNYSCIGCYSRGRNSDDELSTDELDALLTEAEELGVVAIVVTGGEPLLRNDLLDLVTRHRRLFFVPITNGSLVTPQIAKQVVHSGNVLTLVSIEGFPLDTDRRRRPGAHEASLRAFWYLRKAGACYGFAAMNTAVNIAHLSSESFVDQMTALGCSVGFFTEYVPCGPNPKTEWVLDEPARAKFRESVLDLRRRKRIILIQFPHDEYGQDNRCSAAGRLSLHINSRGDVEPCPFAPITCENVRHGGLMTAFQSPFLRAIRENPTLLQRKHFACALFEHRAELEALAARVRSGTERA